jgi:transposase-like protein
MTTATWPKTLQEAIVYFADINRAQEFLIAMRWSNGVTCPTCGSKDVGYITTRRLWQCKNEHPHQQFSIKKGSIMEDSALGLDKWMTAMWLLGNCKNGISSYELARDLHIKQQSAWFMLHRLRLGMQQGSLEKMGAGGGPVEADETFIGGLARFMHAHKRAEKIKGTGGSGKELVAGLLDRETGKVRVKHVANRKRGVLQAEVRANVAKGAQVMTDELASYVGLDKDYIHQFVNHAEEYVKGNVHTQGIDNFWALLKRMIKGTYVSVEPFHLFRYLDEEAFRFNERKHHDGDRGRFMALGRAIFGKRLMYKELTGKICPTATA